jgi:uncharacterized protein Yka (UPF0111/DUF47 family)
MASFLNNFLTNRALFAEQFGAAAKNIVEMAGILNVAVNLDTVAGFDVVYQDMDKRGSLSDGIKHKIYFYLNKIFFTPISRPGIQALASGLDAIAEGIREAASRIYLYHIDECSPAIKEITGILLEACVEIEKAISLIWSTKNTTELSRLCTEVKNFREQADKVYYKALAGLFTEEKNAIELLKYREILLSLETAVNKCKIVTDEMNLVILNKR